MSARPRPAVQCDAALAVVKEWPGSYGACFEQCATAILDDVCAQRHGLKQVGTKKRPFPVEPRNESWKGLERGCSAELAGNSMSDRADLPWRAAGDDRVGEDQQLASAGDDRNLVLFSSGAQPLVERRQLRVPAQRGDPCRGVEIIAQPLAATRDVSIAGVLATVVIVGGKPSQRAGLAAAELADLRHAHHEGACGAQRNAIDAEDQVEPLGEIGMLTDRRHSCLSRCRKSPRNRRISSSQSCRRPASRQDSRWFLNRAIARTTWSIWVCNSASSARRRSGGAWMVLTSDVQAAIKAASILSFFASLR